MSYTMFYSHAQVKPEIKRILSITIVSLAVFTGLMWYYWQPYAYNKFTFGRFWGDPFFEILHLGLVGVIITYLYLQKRSLFKGWMQGALYMILLAHFFHLTNLINAQGQIVALRRVEEITIFLGYLTLALSQIRLKIQPKFILVLLSVLLLSTILTVLMVSNEVRNRLLVFTYEKLSAESALDTVFDLKKVLYLIAGSGVVLASFIGYIFSGRIVNPLTRLVQGTRRVGKGDLSTRIEVETRDELGELAQEFNRMTDSLREQTSKLEKANWRLKIVNQELIEKGQELAQAAKIASIGYLAGGVAHEINNPLMSMLGWAQMGREIVEKEEGKATPEEKKYLKTLKGYLETIEEGTRRCQVVTESLLKISRQMDLDKIQLVDINKVIEDVFSLMLHQAKFKNIEIKKDLSLLLPKVEINVGQIQQVFIDLMSNAALAMPQGGELSISTSCKDDKFVEIKIRDAGCGISSGNLDQIFDPFFTTRKTGKGMGLGLSVAYGIIEQHNGTIEAESKEKAGTTFTIRLPVA
ncbi:MAG: HAMP domain-containing protein [Candidatus Omnitrophica bacterium]|nr:HAMP domain-containing protein [Candidatus Omnitrophota bacterium]